MQSYFAINLNWEIDSNYGIELSNRAYRFGDGFFESMLFFNGNLLHASLHFERLQDTAKVLQIELPPQFKLANFVQHLTNKVNEINLTAARVRFTVLRQSSGTYTPTQNQCLLITEITAHQPYNYNKQGLHLCTYTNVPKPANFLSHFKTCNSLIYVLASLHAKQQGMDASLLINTEGNIAEAQHSNIFVWHNNTLLTPHLNQYCIAGVMRTVVLNMAKDMNIKHKETIITETTLSQAQEVFLTNASQGIIWVARHKTSDYTNHVSYKLYQELKNRYLQ